jgi:pimeloyl-ACP methyl ester carboxylesterase
MFGSVDVSQLLPTVQAPTLVMHCKDDQLVRPERGCFIASKIPGAQFVALDGRNHLPQPQDASWSQIQHELRRFLS